MGMQMGVIMKERTYGIILGILNIVLLTICGVLFLGKDRNAPEILLSDVDFVYAAEKGEEVLLEGVTAMDREDGELTGSVVIEKIVTDMEKETATITYGVADSAGNVGKAACTVEMEVPDGVRMSEDGSEEERVGVKEEGSEGALEESDGSEEEETSTGDSSEDVGESALGEENAGEEETEEERESEGTDAEASASGDGEEPALENEDSEEEGASEGMEEAEREALPVAGEAANQSRTVSSRSNPGRPSMAFRTQEVTVKAGQAPAWVQVIEGLYDDKDNYETLLKSLQVKGTYDKDKAGTYNVTVTVTDADGNESHAYPMKIMVEAWQ